MKLFGYKAGLVLSAIAALGLGIVSTTTTKAASLQVTTGISTVFDSCYASYVRSFKDSGQLLGNSRTASGDSLAFVYSNGQMLYVSTLGSNSTTEDFNNFGLVVGGSKTNAGLFDALLDRNSQMRDKGNFGGYCSVNPAFGINPPGQIVGEFETDDDALICSDSKMQQFDGIGANGALILGNSSGNYRCGQDVALFYR